MSELTARPYQQDGLNQIRKHYAQGTKKVMLHLETGGGKTFMFCEVLKGCHAKGTPAIMVVRGRKLVDQASKRLDREGVPHGVMMAGHKRYAPLFPIQVCSIDTLRSRKLRPDAKVIVIDEAHLATSPSYKEFLDDYKDSYLLPVTATPYTSKSLKHLADVVVKPTTFKDLIDMGFLVPPRYFAPTVPNLKGVKTTTTSEGRDFNSTQLSEVMQDGAIMGDIATEWLDKAKGRPTIAFCVSVKHSEQLTEYLISRGISAEHVDANSTDEERENVLKRLQDGTTSIVCNVGILCIGVDIPNLGCVIMARPTKSLNLYIQQAGRGTRPFSGKSDFILLDHAGNVLRHGFITDERDANLEEDQGPRKAAPIKSPKQCDTCFAVFMGSTCPCCGNTNESKIRQFNVIDGNLKELTAEDLDPVLQFIKAKKKIQKEKGYKRGWVYYQVKERFGDAVAEQHFPQRFIPAWVTRRA